MLLWLFAVVSLSLSPSLPPSIFHPRQLPSFNSCLRLQLGEHITSLTGSIGETQAGFVSHNVISAHPSTSPSCFFYSPHFLSVRSRFVSPHLFQSWHLFFAHILSQMWFCRSSRFLPSPQGLSRSSLLLWTSRPLSISSSLFPPRIKEWNGRFLHSFHHFSHLTLSFWSSVVVMLPPTPSDSSSPQAPFSILIRRREGNFCDSPHLVMFQAILRGWR